MKELYLLFDGRETFYSDHDRESGILPSLNVARLKTLFGEKGLLLHVLHFCDVDLGDSWEGRYVLYQSTEDPQGLYKSYIDDLVYALSCKGAIVIPAYRYLKAHHNKVFMEMLRSLTPAPEIQTLRSRIFGSPEEFASASDIRYPCVIKGWFGAGSRGVTKSDTPAEALDKVKKIAGPFLFREYLRDRARKLLGRVCLPFPYRRNKFIVQPMIQGLKGDYKVLVFGEKYYVVYRQNRPNDFRASGSGLLSRPEKVEPGLLDFAEICYRTFDVAYASFDIGFDGTRYHLIEMQFVSFGPVTLTKSEFYFTRKDSDWTRITGRSDLHEELVNAICRHYHLDEK